MKNHEIEYKDVTADAGYESEENYAYFEACEKDCYIKPQNYERSKTKKFKSNMALQENMAYDPEKDEYTCQAGQKLRAKYVAPIMSSMTVPAVHIRRAAPGPRATVSSVSPRNS